MHIRWIELQGYRCFEHQRIELHDEQTVFFGDNGSGKSALVDAITTLFSGMPGFSQGLLSLEDDDLRVTTSEDAGAWQRLRAGSAKLEICVVKDGKEQTWSSERIRGKKNTTRSGGFEKSILKSVERGLALPLVIVYRANRPWRDERANGDNKKGDPLTAYEDALDAGLSLAELRTWWRAQDHVRSRGGESLLLDAVEEAIAQVTARLVDGGDSGSPSDDSIQLPVFDPQESDVVLDIPEQGRLTLGELSDGYRCVIAMVADIARRAAQLNPVQGADILEATGGVVVVDELDLHLHPKWQMTILPILRDLFPGVQFVVTTHSPQILSSVPAESVRLLGGRGEVFSVNAAKGLDINTILRDLMGAPPRPLAFEQKIGEISELITEGEFKDARERLDELKVFLLDDDPTITALEWELADELSAADEAE